MFGRECGLLVAAREVYFGP